MRKARNAVGIFMSYFIMFVMILDSRFTLKTAQEAIELCTWSVIPSLFPLIFISIKMNGELAGCSIPGLGLLGKITGIPKGSESLLFLGLLGGYPVGAQAIYQAYQAGTIPKSAVKRMLGFCSNAGPAFIFGMFGPLFSNRISVWILWLIHIISAILVGMILPGKSHDRSSTPNRTGVTLSNALEKSLKTIAMICGWVILFRILYQICNRWILFLLPEAVRVLLAGLLELTNGCVMLDSIANEGARFVLASVFLAFGGICVSMQTVSCVGNLGTGLYFPGKLMQAVFSFILSLIIQYLLFPADQALHLPIWIPIAAVLLLIAEVAMIKKYSSIPEEIGV